MAPKKADLAGKKVEAVQDLSPSALELLLPLWDDAFQDSSVPGVLLAAVHQGFSLTFYCCSMYDIALHSMYSSSYKL